MVPAHVQPQAAKAPSSDDRTSLIVQRAVLVLALIFLPTILIVLVVNALPHSLELEFNAFGLLSVVSFLSLMVALTLLLRVKERTNTLMWSSMHLLSLASWAAAEAMIRFSATPGAAAFWAPMTTLGAVFVPITLYMFALSYTSSGRIKQPIIFLSLSTVSVLFIFADFRTQLLAIYDVSRLTPSPWGYIFAAGPAYLSIALWLILLCIATIILLYRFRQRNTDPTLRRQSLLFMIAVLVPLAGGTLTDGVLTALNIVVLPPMTVMASTAMGLIICYGILKYRFFSFTPELIAPQILATMNEAVIGVRPDLRVSYVNAGAQRLLGLTADELMRRHLGDLLPQHFTPAQLKHDLLESLADRDFHTIDSVDLRTASNQIVTVKLSITKIANSSQPDGYLIVLTDITAIAQAKAMIEQQVAEQTQTIRETQAKLENSINSLEFGFIITDARPEVTMINDAAHALFCGSRSHKADVCTVVTLSHIQELFGAAAPLTVAITDSIAGKSARGIKLLSFRHRSMRIFISPMIDRSAAVGTAIIIQDITEEQILSRSRDEFFSIASHELRTPLTAIKGNAGMMIDYYPDAFKDPALHEMVYDIRESSVRLIGIVNDFLDASRLEQGRVTYKLEELSLSKVAEKIIYEMSATAKGKGIFLRLGSGLIKDGAIPRVIADEGRIKQILYNLIGNASKFTNTGGITIDATVAGQYVKITITDTGIGIPPEMQSLLFHKFQQAGDSLLTRDGSKGTGLGLYISQLLAKGMGGDVVLESSEAKKGSVFSLTVPISTPDALKRLSSAATTTDAQTGLTVETPV